MNQPEGWEAIEITVMSRVSPFCFFSSRLQLLGKTDPRASLTIIKK